MSANRFRFICLFFVLEFSTTGITSTHTLDAPPVPLHACGAVFAQPKDTFDLRRFSVMTSNQRKCFGNAIPDLHYCLISCRTRACEIESGPGCAEYNEINVMHDNKCVNTK